MLPCGDKVLGNKRGQQKYIWIYRSVIVANVGGYYARLRSSTGCFNSTGELSAWGNLATAWYPIHGRGVEMLLLDSCNRDRDKLWPDEPLGGHVDGK